MSTSEPRYFKGVYLQGSMPNENAEALMLLLNEYTVVASLKNVIKNLPKHMIMDVKSRAKQYLEENGTFNGFQNVSLPDTPLGTLTDAQTMGVAFMYYAGSALLGDEVGLGKTVQVAGLVNTLRSEYIGKGKTFSFLFLTEKSIVGQIQDKLIQFTGTYIHEIPNGEAKTVKKYIEQNVNGGVYGAVGSHSLLNSPEFILYLAKNPNTLIIYDESKSVKKQSSGLAQNAKEVFALHEKVILLNATPLETELREMYNQLDLLDPEYMPSITQFNKDFSKYKRGMFGYEPDGYKNEEVFAKLIKLRYYARTRKDLGAEYEGNDFRTVFVKLSPEQRTWNNKTTQKQLLVDYPSGVHRSIPFNEETTPKLKALVAILEERVNIGVTQAIVYCRFVKAQDAILEHLSSIGFRVVILNGKTPQGKRKEIADAYTNGEYDIMITNILRGLDLDTCDTAVLYSIDPNPQNMVQFEGRMTRQFDIKNKAVYLIVAMGKEKNNLEKVLKDRVTLAMKLSNTGNSMVLEAISTTENRELFDEEDYKDN